MSRARLIVVSIAACALVGRAASAGINFVGGALTNVAPKPEFMLAGDLDNDGLTDVVVISPPSREVDVFIAAQRESTALQGRGERCGRARTR